MMMIINIAGNDTGNQKLQEKEKLFKEGNIMRVQICLCSEQYFHSPNDVTKCKVSVWGSWKEVAQSEEVDRYLKWVNQKQQQLHVIQRNRETMENGYP